MLSVDAEPAKKSSAKENHFPNLQHLQQNCPDFKAIYTYKTTGKVHHSLRCRMAFYFTSTPLGLEGFQGKKG